MTPKQFQRVEELFHEVRRHPADQQAAVLASLCPDNVEVRGAVEALLTHDDPNGQLSTLQSRVVEALSECVPDVALDPLVGRRVGSYEIVREIRRGGQGVVYQGLHVGTGRKVAIKVLGEGLLAESRHRARFEREVQVLAALDHPNIVTAIDRGVTDDGRYYFVMDYVSGQALDEYVAAFRAKHPEGNAAPGEVLRLFVKICDAVNAAHLRGIVHRDLKPSNIRVDAQGEPHILDFGLARLPVAEMTDEAHPQPVTITGQFLGSLPWASPEQAEGIPAKIDIRSDVYSLGVILYHMLTGKFPYEVVGTMRDVLNNILTAAPTPPSKVIPLPVTTGAPKPAGSRFRRRRPAINEQVEAIVLKALRKERAERYDSAGDFARDVASYLSGKPVTAAPGRPRSRRRAAVQLAGAAGILVVLTVVATVFVVSKAHGPRPDAPAADRASSAPAGEHAVSQPAKGVVRTVPGGPAPARARPETSAPSPNQHAEGAASVLADAYAGATSDLKGNVRRKLQERIVRLDRIAEEHPKDLAAQLDLASACKQLRDTYDTPESNYALLAAVGVFETKALERAISLQPQEASIQTELADGYRDLAWHSNILGRQSEFLFYQEKAVTLRRRIHAAGSASPCEDRLFRDDLARLSAAYQNTGRLADTERIFRELLPILEACAEGTPQGSDERAGLAAGWSDYAAFLANRDPDAALDYATRAIDFFASHNTPFNQNICTPFDVRLRVLRRQGRLAEARDSAMFQVELIREAAALEPHNPYAQLALSTAERDLGDAHFMVGDASTALGLARDAARILELLAAQYPANQTFWGNLVVTYELVAKCARVTGDTQLAEKYVRKAREAETHESALRDPAAWSGDGSPDTSAPASHPAPEPSGEDR